MEFKYMGEKSWKIVYTLVFSSIFAFFFVVRGGIYFITVLLLLAAIPVFYVVSSVIVVVVKEKYDLDKRDQVLVRILALVFILHFVICYVLFLILS